MDKIWYRNPSKSEVIDRCGGDEKTKWPCRTDKSNAKKQNTLSVQTFWHRQHQGTLYKSCAILECCLWSISTQQVQRTSCQQGCQRNPKK